MSLVFQERADGYRVVRMNGDAEVMVASIKSRSQVDRPSCPMTDAEFKARMDEVGVERAVAEREASVKPSLVAVYDPLPLAECSIHSAGGPLSVSDLEEMIGYLKENGYV